MVLRVRDEVAEENLTRCYESPEGAPQTGGPLIRTLQLLLQRPPLAMFDPSLIHRNDEIFNPEPNRLGIFFAQRFFRRGAAGWGLRWALAAGHLALRWKRLGLPARPKRTACPLAGITLRYPMSRG